MTRAYELANLLEKTADYIEELETRQTGKGAEKSASVSPSAEISDLFRAATGEDASDEVTEKIANDPSLMEQFRKLARNASRPDPMGGPVSEEGYDSTQSADRSKAAEDRFLSWIVNS